jgi:hypothetical protein
VRRFLAEMNPTVRGFVVIALIAVVVVALSLDATLTALFLILQIAFFLAIAFFIFLVWRDRRSEIEQWSTRSRAVFYGAAALIVVDIGAFILARPSGRNALAFFLVLILAGFSMVRVWRDERKLSY